MKQAWYSVRGFWSDYPSLDWLPAALFVFAHETLARSDRMGLLVADLAKDDRMRLFTTLASVSALLFGFATASIAFFYGSAKGDRVDLMKKVMSKQLVASWRAALSAPLLAVGVCVLALVVDVGSTGSALVGAAVEIALVLLAARGVRLRWLFTNTLSLMAMDADNPPQRVGSQAFSVVARPGRRS